MITPGTLLYHMPSGTIGIVIYSEDHGQAGRIDNSFRVMWTERDGVYIGQALLHTTQTNVFFRAHVGEEVGVFIIGDGDVGD